MDNTTATYQGYTNKETFTVSLWINNEREHYEMLRHFALSEGYEITMDRADALKAYVENICLNDNEDTMPEPAGTLVSWALDAVNWREIIEGVEE